MQSKRFIIMTLASTVMLLVSSFYSLKIGAFTFSTAQMGQLLFENSSTNEAIIFQDVRLPRMLVTLLVGMNMAVAGALIQGMTQNPLASPGVLGINSGASLFVVASIVFFPGLTGLSLVLVGFLGGALAAGMIFFVGATLRGGRMLVKIALIGVVIQSLFAAATQTLLIFNDESIHQILVWLTGTTAGTVWADLYVLAPISLIGLIIACSKTKALAVLALGDEVARGLGQHVRFQKFVIVCLVVLLAGTSVAFTGPIGFIGLITPHLVRFFITPSHLAYLPLTAISGASLLMSADVVSRFISFPTETPVGIVTALIGAPYFIYLARTIER